MLNVLPPEAISLTAAAEMLRNEEFYVRYNAAKMLSRRGDRDARLIMQDILTNGEPRSRATVARHLYGFSWFSAEPLIKQALKDADPRVREGAIYSLCDLRELNAYQLMVECLQNEEDDVRAAAAWGLRDCQDPAAV
jgi:HEAT repeat protein